MSDESRPGECSGTRQREPYEFSPGEARNVRLMGDTPIFALRLSLMRLGAISAVAWSAVFLVILGRLEAFDPYWFLVLPHIFSTLTTGQANLQSYTPAWEILMVQLSLISAIPVTRLIFVPIGGFSFLLAVYVFGKELTSRWAVASVAAIFLLLEIARSPVAYSTFAD